jgi:hypothetical protein
MPHAPIGINENTTPRPVLSNFGNTLGKRPRWESDLRTRHLMLPVR